jgi:Tfp pilus assembly protein PilF
MKQPQPSKFFESVFPLGALLVMAANRLARACLRQVLLVLMLSAIALTAIAAQSARSRDQDIHNHLRRAAEYLKVNDTNSAIQEFDAVLALDPKNAEANANLGVIAFFQRDYQNASKYLRNALVADPSLTKTQALLGICERRLGQSSGQALLEKSFPKLKEKNLAILSAPPP